MHVSKLVVVLRGGLEGQTIVLNKREFTDGVFEFVGHGDECTSLSTYFDNSYNCNIWIGRPQDPCPLLEEEEAIDEEVVEDDEASVEEEDEMEEPNEREQAIIAAINQIDTEDWVDDVVAHPSVSAVAELMKDASVTKEEIVSVIETWLEDEDEAEEPAEE